jgi:hypothetical protein
MDALAAAWQLVFRKLSLRDIASCCKTCIKLKCAAESYVSHRTKDATEASERYAVPYENSLSNFPYAEIKYVSENVLKTGVTVRATYKSIGAKGCNCFDSPGGGGSNATNQTVSCAMTLKTALDLEPCVPEERRCWQEASGGISYSGEMDGMCDSRDFNNEKGVAESFRRDSILLHHRIQAGLCIRDRCSCGIDLDNEAAYNEAGLLVALLEPQSEHKFPPIEINSGGTSRIVVQENIPLEREQVERQGVWNKKRSLLCPPFAAGPPAKKLEVRDTTGPEGRNDFCHTTSSQHQSPLGMQRQNNSSHDTHKEAHNKEENLDRQTREVASLVIFECGPACRCSLRCTNRCTQRGLSVKVKVIRHRQKGWCLHAAENIEPGAFICQYAGKTFLGEGPVLANVLRDMRSLMTKMPSVFA